MPPLRETTPWLLLAGAGALLFLAGVALAPLDEPVGRALVGAPGVTLVSGGLAFLGGVDFLAPATIVLCIALAGFGRPWGAARAAVVLASADLASRGVKLLVARPRPEWALVEAGGYAFPSGHATDGAALGVLMAWFAIRHLRGRRVAEALLAFAVLYAVAMAMSRVIIGVHHLSDVVAGVGLGIVVASLLLAASLPLQAWVKSRWAARPGSP